MFWLLFLSCTQTLELVEDCTDGRDQDGDGLTDCEDADCAGLRTCEELLCGDEVDDDGDGLTDCEDDDCWGLGRCEMTRELAYGRVAITTTRVREGQLCAVGRAPLTWVDSAWVGPRARQATRVSMSPVTLRAQRRLTGRPCTWEADRWIAATSEGVVLGAALQSPTVAAPCSFADTQAFVPARLVPGPPEPGRDTSLWLRTSPRNTLWLGEALLSVQLSGQDWTRSVTLADNSAFRSSVDEVPWFCRRATSSLRMSWVTR